MKKASKFAAAPAVGRRSTRHADEPRKSLKERSDEEDDDEDAEQDDEEEETRAKPAAAAVDEYDLANDASMEDTRSHASAPSSRGRARHAGPALSFDVKLNEDEKARMAKAKAFFDDLDSKDISDVCEIVRR